MTKVKRMSMGARALRNAKNAARWKALLWRWGSGTVTLDCADNGSFRIYVEHAEAADECYMGATPEEVIDAAIKAEQKNSVDSGKASDV